MLTILQNSTNIRYLLFRLDFNEFYQIREEQKRNFGRGEDEDMDTRQRQERRNEKRLREVVEDVGTEVARSPAPRLQPHAWMRQAFSAKLDPAWM